MDNNTGKNDSKGKASDADKAAPNGAGNNQNTAKSANAGNKHNMN